MLVRFELAGVRGHFVWVNPAQVLAVKAASGGSGIKTVIVLGTKMDGVIEEAVVGSLDAVAAALNNAM